MEQKFCQSCGMPMEAQELYGTEADGSKSADYCRYCYQNGAFSFHGSMEEMIEICMPHMAEANTNITAEQARKIMQQIFPSLKRWQA